jgi:hypothetical protein
MTSTGTDLLRLLGAQAVPGLAPVSQANASAPGSLDFAKILSQAKAGQLSSGREVTIARSAGVNLSDDQMKRLSAAADLAESQGATRALVMIDGMTLKLDVAMREVTGSVNLKASGVLTGIDAVIDVPGEAGQKAQPTTLPASFNNSSLLSILAKHVNPAA